MSEPFRLRPIIEAALDRDHAEPDPAATAHAVLMRLPLDQRETALLRAVEICCWVANEQRVLDGDPAFPGCPVDW